MPSWPHPGAKLANLAQSWPQLGPSWRQDVLQQAAEGSPRGVPISTLGHLGARRLAKSLKTSLGPPFFKILLPFCYRFCPKLLRMLWKTFVLFPLFPFHAKPGLTRPGDQNEAKTRPRWTQDAYLSSSSASLSKHLAKKVAT